MTRARTSAGSAGTRSPLLAQWAHEAPTLVAVQTIPAPVGDVSPFRDQIIFGRAFAEHASASVPQTELAALTDRDGAEAAKGLQWQTA